MSVANRFNYALAPLLATRQWRLDALLLELSAVDRELLRLKDELAVCEEKASQLAVHWKAQTAQPGGLTIDAYAMATKYMQELASKRRAGQTAIGEREQKRMQVAEQLVVLKKEIDAIERHREEQYSKFQQAHANQAFKAFDDQWTILQQRKVSSANEC